MIGEGNYHLTRMGIDHICLLPHHISPFKTLFDRSCFEFCTGAGCIPISSIMVGTRP